MNQLKVHLQHSIVALVEQGWSRRRVARELGLDRGTVRKYLAGVAKPPTPQTGSGDGAPAPSPTPPQTGLSAVSQPSSVCDPWGKEIEAAWQAGLTLQRIYQDLVVEHQFAGSYHAVRRFVRRRLGAVELPFRRMECEPAQELQVDFGRGAWVVEEGKRRRPHLFRCVLSHSRKAYSEVVWRQTSESFIRCLENAFRHFGGVTATVVPDYVPRHIIDLLFPTAICARPVRNLENTARECLSRSHNFQRALSHFISSASSRQTAFRRHASEEAEAGGWHASKAASFIRRLISA